MEHFNFLISFFQFQFVFKYRGRSRFARPTLGHFFKVFNLTWRVPDDDVEVQLIHLDDGEYDEDVAKDNSNAEEEEKQSPIVLPLQGVCCRGEVEVVRKKSGLV